MADKVKISLDEIIRQAAARRVEKLLLEMEAEAMEGVVTENDPFFLDREGTFDDADFSTHQEVIYEGAAPQRVQVVRSQAPAQGVQMIRQAAPAKVEYVEYAAASSVKKLVPEDTDPLAIAAVFTKNAKMTEAVRFEPRHATRHAERFEPSSSFLDDRNVSKRGRGFSGRISGARNNNAVGLGTPRQVDRQAQRFEPFPPGRYVSKRGRGRYFEW